MFLPPDLILNVCVIASMLLFTAGLFVPVAPWLKTFIYVSCVILTGYDIVIDASIKILKDREFNGNLLIVAAAAVAFSIGKGPEGTAALLIFRVGEVLHRRAVKRSADMVEKLMDLRPETVNAVINGAIVQMAPGQIGIGDIISVSPGERIALDGVVTGGASELDVSALNEQAEAQHVTDGCEVLSGSVNLTGVLNLRVTADFDHSTMSRIMRLVEKAENRKAGPEKRIRNFARIYTPAVAGAALILGIMIPVFGGLPLSPWLSRALGLLVLSGSTAMVSAVTLSYFAGIGGASKKGILFKGADVVDTAAHTTSVILSKTGILTDGIFRVIDINSYDIPEKRLLMLAAYAELFSNHPIARSVVAAADILPDFARVSDYHEFVGKGTEIEIGGNTVSAGSAVLMEELGIRPDLTQSDSSVIYIAVNRQYAGRILLRDTIKNDSKNVVKELHAIGIDRIVMFTGDRKEAAADVAGQLGIKEFYAECLPEDKFTRLKGLMEMQLSGDKLVYVGNGSDDAPVLKMADVGITLGGLGTDETTDAADMIIMSDEPSKIATAITIARSTNKIVGQNIMLSLGFKGLTLLFVLLGIAPMWTAALADAVFSLIVIINGMRAFGIQRDGIRKTLPKRLKKTMTL
jgi:Cd2+/Zn2+-exporting ATPase